MLIRLNASSELLKSTPGIIHWLMKKDNCSDVAFVRGPQQRTHSSGQIELTRFQNELLKFQNLLRKTEKLQMKTKKLLMKTKKLQMKLEKLLGNVQNLLRKQQKLLTKLENLLWNVQNLTFSCRSYQIHAKILMQGQKSAWKSLELAYTPLALNSR